MQLQNSWNNIQNTGNGSGSLPNAAAVNSSIASQIEAINAQQMTLQEQIRQSEQNLSAQHNVRNCVEFFFLSDLIFLSIYQFYLHTVSFDRY